MSDNKQQAGTYSHVVRDGKDYLLEVARLQEPNINSAKYNRHEDNPNDYDEDYKAYSDHLASLKSYPCDKSFAGKKNLVEGKDFQITTVETCPYHCSPGDPNCSQKFGICTPEKQAIPLPTSEDQECIGVELWDWVVANDYPSAKKLLNHILNNYSLHRKEKKV